MNEFLQQIEADQMTNSFWKEICNYICKLIKNEKHESSKKDRYTIKCDCFEFDGDSNNRFRGIIHHLTQKSGGNVCEKGVVKVTASSIQMDYQAPKCAVDLDNAYNYFHSNPVKDSWLMYDFGDGRKGYHHLQNWVIEGSETANENDWKVVDRRSGVTCIDDVKVANTFDVQIPLEKNDFFRFLRIRITGGDTSSSSCYHLVLSALEFFGKVMNINK